jgi:hypothetical protein
MADNKKSFLLYCDQIHLFEELTDEEAGRLVKHIFRYVNDQNPEPPDRITKLGFEPIKHQLKRDLVRYEDKVKKASEAGKASAEAKRIAKELLTKQQTLTDVDGRQQTSTDSTDIVTDIVTVKEKKNTGASEVPSEEDFLAYYQSDLSVMFPNLSFSVKAKYESWKDTGWKDGNGKKIVNWKSKLKNTIPYLKPVMGATENQPDHRNNPDPKLGIKRYKPLKEFGDNYEYYLEHCQKYGHTPQPRP